MRKNVYLTLWVLLACCMPKSARMSTSLESLLKNFRAKTATAHSRPRYSIFSDAILKQIAEKELALDVPGVSI